MTLHDADPSPATRATQAAGPRAAPDGDAAAVEAHYRLASPPPLSRECQRRVTLLFGGLTTTHERLIEGAWEGVGFRARALPTPDNEALAIGREYCNKGMCNPAYYTIGNLIKFLIRLKKAGVPRIEDRFVFLTAGSCGPCRFGTYEAEYRRALAQAGFPDFRVVLVQQTRGLEQTAEGSGLALDRPFLLALVRALMVGDLLNELGCALRPYEVEPGSVDAALDQGRRWLYWALRDRESPVPALRRLRRELDRLALDYTRVKPRVKITGEFWAQTTEGDGNYQLVRWLEEEGAEVVIEPVGTWIEYLIWKRLQWLGDRRGLLPESEHATLAELRLRMGQIVFDSVYNTYRAALNFRNEPLVSMDTLGRLADQYYNTRIGGGEGHLEVAKTVFSVRRRRAHMVVSVKPFGCMPSTQSDGVQVKVMADHPDGLFVSVETSGDGEVHVKSRIQMVLFEAKERAREEYEETARRLGLTERLAAGGAADSAQATGAASVAPGAGGAGPAGPTRPDMPAATVPLPRRQIGTAANYLWWLQRPSALRSLPIPSEKLGDLLRWHRRAGE